MTGELVNANLYAGEKSEIIQNMVYEKKEASQMGTVIVLAIVAGAAALAVRSMIKDKKAGKSIHCGGDCSRCGGCH